MALAACGGGSSNPQDSGIEKTYLKVQASDAQGDALSYQWRVTGGTIDNPNGPETVWTLPSTPGLHFAYVLVSDGKGGYAQQQYAASSDAFGGTLAPKPAMAHTPPPADDIAGTSGRLRFVAADNTAFAPADGGAKARRLVVLPDMKVELLSGNTIVAGGLTDLGGELSLPRLPTGQTYTVRCAADDAAAVPANCGTYTVTDVARRLNVFPALTASRNLRLFGHVGLADGGVCAADDEYFGLRRSATVRLLAADGSVLAGPRRVNRFGDYLLDAAVPVTGNLRLEVQCEGLTQTTAVPADAAGYAAERPIEVSVVLANSRPQIQKVVANGPDGNVRGRMVTPLADAESNVLPGGLQFLAYKGADTAASACRYYRSFGATRDCDAQGRMIDPISFDDWKKARGFGADGSGSAKALYINQMDLNLVRRMEAVEQAANDIAFYVCNAPGPDTQTQAETNERIDTALRGERLVACVAMEWSPTPGVNGGQPFTKFLTFGPDGLLLPSVNLDGRGEPAKRQLPRPRQPLAQPRFALFALRHRQLPVRQRPGLDRSRPRRRPACPEPARAQNRSRPQLAHQPADRRLVRRRRHHAGQVLRAAQLARGRRPARHGRRRAALPRGGGRRLSHLPRGHGALVQLGRSHPFAQQHPRAKPCLWRL
jgi:hypothetical protein